MNEYNLIRLNEKQAKGAGEVLSRAFYDNSLFVYLLPNLDERSKKLPEIYEFLVNYGIIYGEVFSISANLEGVAAWLPYWEAEMTIKKALKCGFGELIKSLGSECIKRLEHYENYSNRCHKQYANSSHCYLSTIGVDPVYQGKGYASLLLRAKFSEFDEQNIACYLETNTEKNVSIYQHFGFEIFEEGIVPETNVPSCVMLRKKD